MILKSGKVYTCTFFFLDGQIIPASIAAAIFSFISRSWIILASVLPGTQTCHSRHRQLLSLRICTPIGGSILESDIPRYRLVMLLFNAPHASSSEQYGDFSCCYGCCRCCRHLHRFHGHIRRHWLSNFLDKALSICAAGAPGAWVHLTEKIEPCELV